MKMYLLILLSTSVFLACFSPKSEQKQKKQITKQQTTEETIGSIALPQGFVRVPVKKYSFAEYLRNLKLKKDKTVYDFEGNVVMTPENGYQYAVIDIDVGNRDLQQCADAVIRLRAEYLYSLKKYEQIHFNFYDGKARYYTDYAGKDHSYIKFRKYMDYIFTYANTHTLRHEMKKANISDMQIGEVFIQEGVPFGHAVIVVDMAENPTTKEKIFMVAQSFMPAQSIHILKKYEDESPWFSTDFGKELVLPGWTFTTDNLYRFKTNF